MEKKKAAKIFIEDINYIDGYIFYKRFESTKPSPGGGPGQFKYVAVILGGAGRN